MSLIVTACTSEGIVMASDSRSTYSRTEEKESGKYVQFGIHYSDTTYKTFLCKNIGISTCGDGTICGISIAGHIENFVNNIYKPDDSVETVANKLLTYFCELNEKSSIVFHVAGYKKEEEKDVPVVFSVNTGIKRCDIIRNGDCGANWEGEISILTRLMKNSFVVSDKDVIPVDELTISSKKEDGTEETTVLKNRLTIPHDSLRQPEFDMAWDLLTLQDGIDFAQFAIKTTIDSMRFKIGPKTVGGPIDILVIKPNDAKWIQHKELHS